LPTFLFHFDYIQACKHNISSTKKLWSSPHTAPCEILTLCTIGASFSATFNWLSTWLPGLHVRKHLLAESAGGIPEQEQPAVLLEHAEQEPPRERAHYGQRADCGSHGSFRRISGNSRPRGRNFVSLPCDHAGQRQQRNVADQRPATHRR